MARPRRSARVCRVKWVPSRAQMRFRLTVLPTWEPVWPRTRSVNSWQCQCSGSAKTPRSLGSSTARKSGMLPRAAMILARSGWTRQCSASFVC